jgi:hypothetical protein
MTKRYPNAHDARCIDQPCDEKVYVRGRCQRHYNANYHKTRNRNFYDPTRGHDGLVPVTQKGWGCL